MPVACEQSEDRLWLYAMDALDPAEREAIHAHLEAGCPTCERRLAEARQQAGDVLAGLEPVAPPPRVKQRLMERVRADKAERAEARYWVTRRPVSAAATAAVGAIALALLLSVGWDDSNATSPPEDRPGKETAAQQARGQVGETDGNNTPALPTQPSPQPMSQLDQQVFAMLRAPGSQVIPLASPGEASAWGRLLFNGQRETGYIFTVGLEPPRDGRRYTLWLFTRDGRAIPVRSFSLDRQGQDPIAFDLPGDIERVDRLRRASVTLEAAGQTAPPAEPSRPMLTGNFPQPVDEP